MVCLNPGVWEPDAGPVENVMALFGKGKDGAGKGKN
jgi:hypothetical protein